MTFKNEFQETSLVAATFNLVGSNLSEDKTSATSKAEVNKTEELEEPDTLTDKSGIEFSQTADHPTPAY